MREPDMFEPMTKYLQESGYSILQVSTGAKKGWLIQYEIGKKV